MGDNDLLGKIFSAAAGVWAIFLALVVAIFKAWPAIMARQNERKRDSATEKAGDWERLRAEIERLHVAIANRERLLAERDDENAALQRQNIELLGRAVTAEAALMGMGVARQQVTILKGIAEKPEGNGK